MSVSNLEKSLSEIKSDENARQIPVRCAGHGKEYDIEVEAGLLARVGAEVRLALTPNARHIFIISNKKVFRLYGERAVDSLQAEGFNVTHWLMGDGERFKSLRTLERVLCALAESGIERSDAVVALGGGVVGDLAGLAAALYLRGIAFIQVPTTLVAQIDASVGGKTAVNLPTGKNLIGAFHQPDKVLIDTETLLSLPRRELTAGWCEAIKQGAVGSRQLFDETCRFLAEESPVDEKFNSFARLNRLIASQVAFKAAIVAGDEREDIENKSSRSRRILNFGHTVGHALEAVTNFRRFRHGEAVGYGMLAAGEISARLGLLDSSELKHLRRAVRLAGRLPPADDLNRGSIMEALTRDKKSIGNSVQWVLLEKLGEARIACGREIPPHLINSSLNAALRSDSEITEVANKLQR